MSIRRWLRYTWARFLDLVDACRGDIPDKHRRDHVDD